MLKQVSRLDYFTLQVFIGLVELKNGSAVAEKLSTTQSKVSRALTTLRDVLGDELFIRKKYGFEPNQVALKITPMVQTILQQFDKIIETTLDKREAPYELTFAANEHWSLMVLNCIQQSCRCVDGGVYVNVQPWSETVSQRLCQGKIDCSISIEPVNHPMVNDTKIGDITHFFIVAKTGHPILESSQPLKDIFDYKIALVNSNLQGHQMHRIEEYAQAKDIDIKVVLKSPSVRMVVDHVSMTGDVGILVSAMSYYYFENRKDVDFVDISDDWRNAPELTSDSYYLHCHQSVLSPMVNCLRNLLGDKLVEMQSHYDNITTSTSPAKPLTTCCTNKSCSALQCDADCQQRSCMVANQYNN
ncbi:LysR family transcriptional regulator [Shewanella sp. Choline-02u-19]|uniref:LysR family transcriptional regulator n=1 Tax=unclassified Shewanella TaxID=196818 RepID=UPI000C34EE0D|nr:MULTISPECIES: LysR family transcriptional regulator [unclassified Shewanella]PKG55420.1 LysR family transcriptional regulator [Shewanella sp. GutDb-MelDb]PKG76089.1 LysR family transcriptional regulator [Shewanella sp. GutCb]PKH56629.1 LysR family transcriptional regulator [Shewanella sp. Bg11-22]PKI30180.1 LysR family transcriptional regulator [Shewanella sp. Choline-02u-19]